MRLLELIFQGIYGCVTPVRLDFSKPIASCELPGGLGPTCVHDVVFSLLYPGNLTHSMRVEYANSESRVAMTFDHRGNHFRLVRKGARDSVAVQAKTESGGFKTLSAGAEVGDFLRKNFGVPDFEIMWSINCWRFEDSNVEATRFDPQMLSPEIRELVDQYKDASALEKAEDRVQGLETRIAKCRKELGQGAALEEKLEEARQRLSEIELSELKRDDLEVLRSRDDRFSDFEDQLKRLEHEERIERDELREVMPVRWFMEPVFWAGLAISLVAIGVSFAYADSSLRAVALADILGFGMCAWVLINYFGGMERAAVHQVKLESIKRRINQVREEQVSLKERLNHLLVHAKVDDAQSLQERIVKTEKLREIIKKMEEQVAELVRDPEYLKSRDELEELEAELEEAQAAKAELAVSEMSAYQLEGDLAQLGVDPKEVLEAADAEDDPRDAFERLLDAARLSGQYGEAELYGKTQKMWGRIAGHVIGDRFKSVTIRDENVWVSGLDAEQVAMWRRTRPSEYFALLVAFALALQVNISQRSRRGYLNTVLAIDPALRLSSGQSARLHEVFESAAKKSPIVILKPDR